MPQTQDNDEAEQPQLPPQFSVLPNISISANGIEIHATGYTLEQVAEGIDFSISRLMQHRELFGLAKDKNPPSTHR